MSGSAHVTAWHLIGVNVFFLNKTIGHAIRSCRIMSANQITLGAIRAVGAAVEDEFYALSDHHAVLLDACLNSYHRAVARISGDQLLVIIDQQLNWPPRSFCQCITKRDFIGVSLATEIPADVAWMHDQTCGNDLQRVADLFAQIERALGRSPNFCAAVGIHPCQTTVGLDVGLMYRRNRVSVLYGDVGLTETFLHFPLPPSEMHEKVARRLDRVQQALIPY